MANLRMPVHLDKNGSNYFQQLGSRDWGIYMRALFRVTIHGQEGVSSEAKSHRAREDAVIWEFVRKQPQMIREALEKHKMCDTAPQARLVLETAFEAVSMNMNDVTQDSAECIFNTRVIDPKTTCKCTTFVMADGKRRVYTMHIFFATMLQMVRLVTENETRCIAIIKQWVEKTETASEEMVAEHSDLLLCKNSYNQAISYLYIFISRFSGVLIT
jgi:hypothetical protein